jgi:hypothetical protein
LAGKAVKEDRMIDEDEERRGWGGGRERRRWRSGGRSEETARAQGVRVGVVRARAVLLPTGGGARGPGEETRRTQDYASARARENGPHIVAGGAHEPALYSGQSGVCMREREGPSCISRTAGRVWSRSRCDSGVETARTVAAGRACEKWVVCDRNGGGVRAEGTVG